jgi:hypothetical protein
MVRRRLRTRIPAIAFVTAWEFPNRVLWIAEAAAS